MPTNPHRPSPKPRACCASGGRLLLSSLAKHEHRNAVQAYGHSNLGFAAKDLHKFVEKAGLRITSTETVTREKRPPHFEVISLIGAQAVTTLPWKQPARVASAGTAALARRILVIDGAMGTMIQRHELAEADYRGERFAEGYDAAFLDLCAPADGHAHGAGCGCEAQDQRATTTC